MVKINAEQVMILHSEVIKATGGIDGVRDYGLLEASLASPFQTFGGIDLYPSDEEKIARLGFNLIANHVFYDGNKRVGILVFLTCLSLNNINVKFTDDELINIGLAVANGKMNDEHLLQCIQSHKVKETNKKVNQDNELSI